LRENDAQTDVAQRLAAPVRERRISMPCGLRPGFGSRGGVRIG
jgi:hypothetical protein